MGTHSAVGPESSGVGPATRPGGLSFGPAVERHHVRLDVVDPDRTYVVGDVHGCIEELRALLARIEPSGDDIVVFVGDLVRKGPDSEAVVELVRSRPNCYSVRGNNEQKVLDGTAEPGLSAASREWLASLPLAISVGGTLVVHGGIDTRKRLVTQTPTDLLESRSVAAAGGYARPFWFEEYAGPPQVCFGHTVVSDPVTCEWAVGLDTGCVHGRQLTAYDATGGELLQVAAETTYEPRSPDSIVTTSELACGRGDSR